MRTLFSLKLVLTLTISLFAVTLTVLVTLLIGQSGVRRVEREIGVSLAMLADQMQDKLDRALYERYREINNAAQLFKTLGIASRPEIWRAFMEQVQATNQDYAWIGYVDKAGKVVRGTAGVLEGSEVAQRFWFQAALKEPVVGDVHESVQLASLLPKRGKDVPRFVDVAAPVVDNEGETVGVLVAHLNWGWADEIKESLFGTPATGRAAEPLVLSREGSVLLGPPELSGHKLNLKSVEAAMTGSNLFEREVWPDGKVYVTGYAKSDGHRTFSGLGWIVLVRQRAGIALASARSLQRQVFISGLAIAGLAALTAWVLADRISAPLLRLATAAEAIRRGERTPIPEVRVYAEADTLSRSLHTLVVELQQRETSLEAQVRERTNELADRNAALTVARNEAVQATVAKSRFLAAASHDLRQPLQAVTLFARALSRRVSDEEAVRLVEQIERALGSLKTMFDALLNISRLDAGLIAPRPEPVCLHELIARVSAGFRAEAEQKRLHFSSIAVDAVVLTDPAILEAMLRNLVSNALKFTNSGEILLAARRRGAAIALEVCDTGPGIPPAEQSRIFREFERGKEQAEGADEGLGLGLSIVERYARLLNMRVELRSKVGCGSRFAILVPQDLMVARATAAGSSTGAEVMNVAGKRILVLDDDQLIVAALTVDLRDRGNDARGFTMAAQADAAVAGGFIPDAAVVDFQLSGKQTGPEFIRRLENRLGHPVPTLVLSGGTEPETLAHLIASGLAWMTKPADPNAVASRLGELCKETPAWV